MIAALLVLAMPSLTAMARGTALLTNGPASTLPAYVDAAGRENPDVGTIVLTPQNEGGVSSRVVWGGSETLGGQATIISTRIHRERRRPRGGELTANLVTSAAEDAIGELAGRRASASSCSRPRPHPNPTLARAFRLAAETALDQREALDAVGETAKGTLWRVTQPVEPRARRVGIRP